MQVKKLMFFSLILLSSNSLVFSMQEIKTIQTNKVKEHWLTPTTCPTEIEYSNESDDDVCNYIRDRRKTDQALNAFLEDNKDCKILLVGAHSLKTIDYFLMKDEARPRKKSSSCVIL